MEQKSLEVGLATKYLPRATYRLVYEGKYAADDTFKFGLKDLTTGEPQMTITCCLDHRILLSKSIVVKDWSENEGILSALIDADLIEPPVGAVDAGYATGWICMMRPRMLELIQ